MDYEIIIYDNELWKLLRNVNFCGFITGKGTFYIDNGFQFGQLFLYGNDFNLFILNFCLLLSVYLISNSLIVAIVAVCGFSVVSSFSQKEIGKKCASLP